MNFDNINLLPGEKFSLFLFNFKKKRIEEKIKHFHSLYYEYQFIDSNKSDSVDGFGAPIPDGTYSVSIKYLRYKVYLRRKRFESLPNWVAIVISLFSLIVTSLSLLWQLGYI